MNTPDTYFSLFLGYSAVWAIVLFFVFNLIREQRRLQLRLKELEGLIERRGDKAQNRLAENA